MQKAKASEGSLLCGQIKQRAFVPDLQVRRKRAPAGRFIQLRLAPNSRLFSPDMKIALFASPLRRFWRRLCHFWLLELRLDLKGISLSHVLNKLAKRHARATLAFWLFTASVHAVSTL
jgi:hypothetical protein